ncbi:MAG: alpha/beta fold hydrolase [Bacteroidota bacterium]
MSQQNASATPRWLDPQLYPFSPNYLTLDAGRLHYLDEGEGEVLLFVHGTPTWSFLYRQLIRSLSGHCRCIAPDHLGFGRSEKPPQFSGTPQEHAQNLSALIRHLDLRDITLVVHDFGGPIGLGAGLENADRIKRVVLFNSWLWATEQDPGAQKVDRFVRGWLGKMLYLNFNLSARLLIPQGFENRSKLTPQVHQHYRRPFASRQERWGPLRLAQALVGASDWYQQQWERLDRLADRPWLILWGLRDQFLGPEYLDRWRARLPEAQVQTWDCGHFVPDEQATASTAAIEAFLERGTHRF